jgi:hypothetical protein
MNGHQARKVIKALIGMQNGQSIEATTHTGSHNLSKELSLEIA